MRRLRGGEAAEGGVAVLVGEPIGLNLLVGLVAIGGGIWIASTEAHAA